jgi:hypothetical protein
MQRFVFYLSGTAAVKSKKVKFVTGFTFYQELQQLTRFWN